MNVYEMLQQCENGMEREALVRMLHVMETGNAAKTEYIGNEHSGFNTILFRHKGEEYRYSPWSGADGCGNWSLHPV